MSVETLEQKIAKQEERLRQLKAQKQAIAAREKKKNSDRQRKDDTRRKILLGAWVLNKLKNDESFKGQLTDFEKFLSTESKTEENRQKDKDL
jgi:multidrug resistance efflux pump